MKGVTKWFIGFLTLLGLFVPSLLISSDVNALKYDIEYIPFLVDNSRNNLTASTPALYSPLGFKSSESFTLKSNTLRYFDNNKLDSGNCSYRSNSLASSSLIYPSYVIPTHLSFGHPDLLSGNNYCNSDFAMTDYNVNSLTGVTPLNLRLELEGFLPYRYDYNGAYLKSSYTDNGFNIQSKFDFYEIFTDENIPDSFTYIDIPIGWSSEPWSVGSTYQFSGSFYFDSDTPDTSVLTLGSDSSLQLIGRFYNNANQYINTQNYPVSSAPSSCSISVSENTNPDEFPYILSYTCDLVINSVSSGYESSGNISAFTLRFTGSPIWSYTNTIRIIYDSSVVITNSDSTPSDHSFQNFEFQGNSHDAPGYAGTTAEDIISDDGINWTNSLINLFSFNFYNPFYPLFGLFTDANSCVDIPIIANMLHSEETTYCPWFPSSVRLVLTPVFGLASFMLIFGFLVRWLGASSGNLFEDSGSSDSTPEHSASSYHSRGTYPRKGGKK